MYRFGKRSLKELEGVDEQLVAICHRAIEITEVDFSVHDGIRTLEEQQRLFDSGASKTLKSKHLTGHAVDLVPYINGKLRWEWPPIYKIAEAVQQATLEVSPGLNIRWGGAWGLEFIATELSPEELLILYSESYREKEERQPFLDGPHFELVED